MTRTFVSSTIRFSSVRNDTVLGRGLKLMSLISASHLLRDLIKVLNGSIGLLRTL